MPVFGPFGEIDVGGKGDAKARKSGVKGHRKRREGNEQNVIKIIGGRGKVPLLFANAARQKIAKKRKGEQKEGQPDKQITHQREVLLLRGDEMGG